MKKFENLKISDQLYLTGKGTTFMVDLKDNGFCDGRYTDKMPISKDDIILHDGNDYKVTGVETHRNLLDGQFSSYIGVQVRSILNYNS